MDPLYQFLHYAWLIMAWTQVVPAVVGIIRYRQVAPQYRVWVWIMVIGFLNEVATLIMGKLIHTGSYNTNLYVLFESLAVLYFFYRLHDRARKRSYVTLIIITAVLWIIDNLIWHRLGRVNTYFQLYYDVLVVFLTIDAINKIIVTERVSMFKSQVFLMLLAMIAYFPLRSFSVIFYLLINHVDIKVVLSAAFVTNIGNVIANTFFTIAFLCKPRPKKPLFTTLSE